MEFWQELLIRVPFYIMAGFTLEIIFSVTGIELCVGKKLNKQTPHHYLEGFVSLYMIPIHGFGMFFGFEFMAALISEFHFVFRYLIWALMFTSAEALTGFIYQKTLGFYPWDYYKESKFKVFKDGYTLWTLLPLWGIAGMVLEGYSSLIIHLTPEILNFLTR